MEAEPTRELHGNSEAHTQIIKIFLDFQDETQFGSDKIRSIKYMKHSEA